MDIEFIKKYGNNVVPMRNLCKIFPSGGLVTRYSLVYYIIGVNWLPSNWLVLANHTNHPGHKQKWLKQICRMVVTKNSLALFTGRNSEKLVLL